MTDFGRINARDRIFFTQLAQGILDRRKRWNEYQKTFLLGAGMYVTDVQKDFFTITSDSVQGMRNADLIMWWRQDTLTTEQHFFLITDTIDNLRISQEYADKFWTWVITIKDRESKSWNTL